MIIFRMDGGLGNQLFQYAIGRKLAITYNTDLVLDVKTFKTYEPRAFELDKFNIRAETLIDHGGVRYTPVKMPLPLYKMMNPLIGNFILPYITESKKDYFKFNDKYLRTGKNAVIRGYFQTEKYFHDISSVLNTELTVKTNLSPHNEAVLQRITNSQSVSIHIRRGDYISNPDIYALTRDGNLDYYSKAIAFISNKISNPFFFLFTDDPAWVKQAMNGHQGYYEIISHNMENGYEDIRLMSCCKHNIIANSSFSWWGAWLNRNPDKIVIAPDKWNSDSDTTYDILPEHWIKITARGRFS